MVCHDAIGEMRIGWLVITIVITALHADVRCNITTMVEDMYMVIDKAHIDYIIYYIIY